jgi:hypothetical protein
MAFRKPFQREARPMRCLRGGVYACTLSLLFAAGTSWGQSMYKVVTPDGKVVYTDRAPASSPAAVQLTPPQGARVLVAPGMGGGGSLPMVPAPPPHTLEAVRGTQEMSGLRECYRANSSTMSLIRAAEDVVRSVNNQKVATASVNPSYQRDLLDRQWKYYKSLGGTAATPEEVRIPEDPCNAEKTALQQKTAQMETQYRACVDAHPREMRLFALSRDLISARSYVAMASKINSQPGDFSAEVRARAGQVDLAAAKAGLAAQFQEYRGLGGTAAQIEEVRELPNPCLPKESTAPQPSAITSKRTMIVPGQPMSK